MIICDKLDFYFLKEIFQGGIKLGMFFFLVKLS